MTSPSPTGAAQPRVETVRKLQPKALILWGLILIALIWGGIAIFGSKADNIAQIQDSVIKACTARAAEAAPKNGMTWSGVPTETPAASEREGDSPRGSDQVWGVTGKIPAGVAPWTEDMTFYSCTVYVSDNGVVDQIRDFRIFG